jgi:hypothetical protein
MRWSPVDSRKSMWQGRAMEVRRYQTCVTRCVTEPLTIFIKVFIKDLINWLTLS